MMSQFKKIFDVHFFFSNVLVPLAALALYCGSFAYFSSRYLVHGVNYFFVMRVGQYAVGGVAIAALIFLAILWTRRGAPVTLKPPADRLRPGSFFLLLLPLTPIVQYIVNNWDILSVSESLYLLVIFGIFSGFYILFVPALLNKFLHTQTLMIMGLAFVFTIVSMASISAYYTWFEKGSLREQLPVFGGVFLVTWLLYNLNQKAVLHLFIAASFVVNSSIQLLSKSGEVDESSLLMEDNKLLMLTRDRLLAFKPNIYLLVYDAYVPNETMLEYGIDNSVQESYLGEQGFTLYPHTYSVGDSTLTTMSKVLNASTDYYGNRRRAASGDGTVQKLFHSLGYDTYGLFSSDYMFRGYGESYDYSIPERSISPSFQLVKGILVGEFRFDIENVGFDKRPRGGFVETRQNIFTTASGGRVFIYMHSNRPAHSQNSGACLPNETALYKERLNQANLEMRQDVDLITEYDPGAIIIVAGDHGPYLTKNCTATAEVYDISEISRLDIQDRHGSFLAIRWPTGDFVEYDDITVIQDVFPAIFAYLYKDPTILEAKIEPIIVASESISGAGVNHGIIIGGIDDGEPLYLSNE